MQISIFAATFVAVFVKNDILKSAEKMPEENYGFKPAPRVRTFGQILGHVAEEQ
jgi:hypothetical protein